MKIDIQHIHYERIGSGLIKVSAIVGQEHAQTGATVHWTLPIDAMVEVRRIIAGTCPVIAKG